MQCVSAVRFSVSIWHIMQTASEVVSEMFQYLNDVCGICVFGNDVCGICVFGILKNARWGPMKSLKWLSIDTCKSLCAQTV